MEKAQATQTVQHVRSESEAEELRQEMESAKVDWAPGFIRQFPWLGFGALCGILACMVGSMIVLLMSNNRSQNDWPEQVEPNVLINIMNSLSAILFAIAIGNGVAIAWWRKTLKGATIEELHRSWSFSTSLKDIFLSLKYFNVIALAALTAKLALVDSTLMQKATYTILRDDPAYQINNLRGFASAEFLPSGRSVEGATTGSSLFEHFKDDLKIWSRSPFLLPNGFHGCIGKCFADIPAAGFAIECQDPTTQDVDFGNQTIFWNTQIGGTDDWLLRDQYRQNSRVELFEIKFSMNMITAGVGGDDTGSSIFMEMLWSSAPDSTDSSSCPGLLNRQTCTLRPSLINYPIEINNHSDTNAINGMTVGSNEAAHLSKPDATDGIYSAESKQLHGYTVIKPIDIVQTVTTDANGAIVDDKMDELLAGLTLGLQMYAGANATMENPSTGYVATQGGHAANYLLNNPDDQSCSYRYTSPLSPSPEAKVESVIARINEITFALATDISNEYFPSQADKDAKFADYSAKVYSQSIHYVSRWAFMAGAMASTVVCILLVIPSYYGFWQLGRKVTLGPLEIAHAFRSPMTAEAKNATLDEMLKEVGQREIQYGQIVAGDARGVVGVAEPEYVAKLAGAPKTK